MGRKRSSFPAHTRILKKYNKARAIMGKRSMGWERMMVDAANDDKAIKGKGHGGLRWLSYLNRAK